MASIFDIPAPKIDVPVDNNHKISFTFKDKSNKYNMKQYYNKKSYFKHDNKFMRKNHSLKQPWSGKSKY